MNLAEYIRSEISRRGLSVRKAAGRIGVSHVTLLRIFRGETPCLDTLDKLSRWTGTSLVYMLQLLGYQVEAESDEVTRLARLVENSPDYERLLGLLERLGPEELELVTDYLRYLEWRLSGRIDRD
ncbi:MAG: helix-turn-helix domain-containing protein [Anaerolineae bacterium]